MGNNYLTLLAAVSADNSNGSRFQMKSAVSSGTTSIWGVSPSNVTVSLGKSAAIFNGDVPFSLVTHGPDARRQGVTEGSGLIDFCGQSESNNGCHPRDNPHLVIGDKLAYA